MDAGCRQIVAALTARGETVAVAESLTAGLVCSALADVPGASMVLRGGVIAYAIALKSALLGVDRGVLEETGAVTAEVALAMARGVAERTGSGWGLATTGVAGPGPDDRGIPAGTVFIAVVPPHGPALVEHLTLTGDRGSVRAQTRDTILRRLCELLSAPTELPT